MRANDQQFGGDHYISTGYQHWDFVVDNAIPYLHAIAIKYASRWRNKGGLEDLRKCGHCIVKIKETGEALAPICEKEVERFTSQFCADDARLIELILLSDFAGADRQLAKLLDTADPDQPPREYVNPDL